MININFFNNKNIFVTGHSGFKGSWLSQILKQFGANVTGYSLAPPTQPSLFRIANMEEGMTSIVGDIRDLDKLQKVFNEASPDIVIHLAAQPIVRDSYNNPVYTYETNVMGTVNILECIRNSSTVKSVLNVTTDKVYENKEWDWGYRETDRLNGFDPYSNSKSCSELVTKSYINSFFKNNQRALSTARAGNVIGGGDFASDRIIPDCIRSAVEKKNIGIRNPFSIRPYQHVLEPLFAYLLIVEKQYDNYDNADFYNIGPNDDDCVSTGDLATIFCTKWKSGISWIDQFENGPHEANFLKLDSSHIKNKLGWQPKWSIDTAIDKTIEWHRCYLENKNINECMNKQIASYINLF